MKAWDRRGLIEDAVARAVDDWLHVADFVSIGRRTGLTSREGLRAVALGLISETVAKGLMVAGDADELGFHAWEISPGDAIQRIAQAWDEDDLGPTPGAVAWFANTPEGERLGKGVLAGES